MRERERLMKLISDMPKEQTVAEMADYLLESGVIVLPVKIGDTVYTNIPGSWWLRDGDLPCKARVAYIGIDGSTDYMNIVYEKNSDTLTFDLDDIGKTVFLTREAAEKALAERNGEK